VLTLGKGKGMKAANTDVTKYKGLSSKDVGPRMAILFSVMLAFLLGVSQTHAEDYLQVARYLDVRTVPAIDQTEVLKAPVMKTIPPQVKSVGKAIKFIAKTINWDTTEDPFLLMEVSALYKKRLPDVHRNLVGQSIQQALMTVAGPAYQLVVDPVSRQVSFKLRKKYKVM